MTALVDQSAAMRGEKVEPHRAIGRHRSCCCGKDALDAIGHVIIPEL
jgi:hypothetical protein